MSSAYNSATNAFTRGAHRAPHENVSTEAKPPLDPIAVNFGRGLGEIRRGTLHLLRASPGRFGAIVVETSSNS